jgi:hypothetical protein
VRERELADLFIAIGVDAGVQIERVTEELGTLVLPSFVDARAFRAALIDTAEAQLRAQLDDRIRRMRRQMGVEGAAAASASASSGATPIVARLNMPAPEPEPAMGSETIVEQIPDGAQNMLGPDELPSDATMVWQTRHP